jgi:hypothetical protein
MQKGRSTATKKTLMEQISPKYRLTLTKATEPVILRGFGRSTLDQMPGWTEIVVQLRSIKPYEQFKLDVPAQLQESFKKRGLLRDFKGNLYQKIRREIKAQKLSKQVVVRNPRQGDYLLIEGIEPS